VQDRVTHPGRVTVVLDKAAVEDRVMVPDRVTGSDRGTAPARRQRRTGRLPLAFRRA